MQKLGALPKIEIKAAQTSFNLPLEGFEAGAGGSRNLLCGALKTSAPKSVRREGERTEAAGPRAQGQHPRQPDRRSAGEDEPQSPASPANQPATKSPAAGPEQELVEERTFLTYKGPKGTFRLEALVVRPAKADGRLPIALITHGKNLKAEENQALRADLFRRRPVISPPAAGSRSSSSGAATASRTASRAYRGARPTCPARTRDLVRGFDIEADDLDAALKVIAARPDADGSRVIAVGQSLGGGTVLAFAARKPAGLIGVVNVSGGVWRTDGNGGVCDFEALTSAMATFGARTRVPTLWLYAENDSLFPPDVVARMHAAYTEAGGRAKLWTFPPIMHDGHNLFADFSGRVKWLRAVDRFLQANRMPNSERGSRPGSDERDQARGQRTAGG